MMNMTAVNETEPDLTARFETLQRNVDAFFLIINATIIYFMQCGFAILECGAVRSKNATNILIKNMLDSLIGSICYWVIGYPLAFGLGNAFCGTEYWASAGVEPYDLAVTFFHYTFAVTASTIVSGAVAERCNFNAYIIYSVVFTAFMYPVVSHWAWAPEGWLYQGLTFEGVTVSYQDFAGSGVVHLVGGTAGFWGALLLGPRIGRFHSLSQNQEEIRGHSVPMAALGGFILFLGFFSFNGGSQASISQPGDAEAIATAVFNTIISGAMGAVVTVMGRLILGRIYGDEEGEGQGETKWSLLSTINGGLSGMVAICAGCNAMYPWSAAVTGAVAGLAYQFVSWLMLRFEIDDPLDAVAVHFGSGMWGIIAVGLFDKTRGAFLHPSMESGYLMAINLAGAAAIIAWTTVISGGCFGILKAFKMLRVSEELEIKGLDIEEHGEAAYPVSAYKDNALLDHLKDLFEEIADPESAKKKKRTKKQAIADTLEQFSKANLVMVNGSLMLNNPENISKRRESKNEEELIKKTTKEHIEAKKQAAKQEVEALKKESKEKVQAIRRASSGDLALSVPPISEETTVNGEVESVVIVDNDSKNNDTTYLRRNSKIEEENVKRATKEQIEAKRQAVKDEIIKLQRASEEWIQAIRSASQSKPPSNKQKIRKRAVANGVVDQSTTRL